MKHNSKEERIKSFIRQIRNPYCFKVGNVVVKTVFADTDVTLDDRLEHYLPLSKCIDIIRRGPLR